MDPISGEAHSQGGQKRNVEPPVAAWSRDRATTGGQGPGESLGPFKVSASVTLGFIGRSRSRQSPPESGRWRRWLPQLSSFSHLSSRAWCPGGHSIHVVCSAIGAPCCGVVRRPRHNRRTTPQQGRRLGHGKSAGVGRTGMLANHQGGVDGDACGRRCPAALARLPG